MNDGVCETTAIVMINILPSNDRLPVFTENIYNYSVTELSTLTLEPSVSQVSIFREDVDIYVIFPTGTYYNRKVNKNYGC